MLGIVCLECVGRQMLGIIKSQREICGGGGWVRRRHRRCRRAVLRCLARLFRCGSRVPAAAPVGGDSWFEPCLTPRIAHNQAKARAKLSKGALVIGQVATDIDTLAHATPDCPGGRYAEEQGATGGVGNADIAVPSPPVSGSGEHEQRATRASWGPGAGRGVGSGSTRFCCLSFTRRDPVDSIDDEGHHDPRQGLEH